jgi:hypothetical protein
MKGGESGAMKGGESAGMKGGESAVMKGGESGAIKTGGGDRGVGPIEGQASPGARAAEAQSMDAVAAKFLAAEAAATPMNEAPAPATARPEPSSIPELLARVDVAQSVEQPFQQLQEWRESEGLHPTKGAAAKLEIQGRTVEGEVFIGKNAHGEDVLLVVNPGSREHAETDVFNQAAEAGLEGGDAHLTVDRELCAYCEQNGAVKSLAKQLKLDSLIVTDPSGTRIIPLKTEQVGHAPRATRAERAEYGEFVSEVQHEVDPHAEEAQAYVRAAERQASRLAQRIAREEAELARPGDEVFAEAERQERDAILKELNIALRSGSKGR